MCRYFLWYCMNLKKFWVLLLCWWLRLAALGIYYRMFGFNYLQSWSCFHCFKFANLNYICLSLLFKKLYYGKLILMLKVHIFWHKIILYSVYIVCYRQQCTLWGTYLIIYLINSETLFHIWKYFFQSYIHFVQNTLMT